MGSVKDVLETPCMQVCACGKATVQTGHCVAFDPIAKHWTLIVWPTEQAYISARGGSIEVYAIKNVCGCPVCFVPARKECAVGPEQMPTEALDHLRKLHAEKEKPKVEPESDEKDTTMVFDLPAPQEV